MPRSVNITVENSFVKGLITEATGLNFPENACVDTSDCIFDKTGTVSRRPGLTLNNDFGSTSTLKNIEDSAITEYLWQGVAKNGEMTFVVLQIGDILSFYRVNTTESVYSPETFTVDISSFKVTGAPTTKQTQCSFTSGNGILVVTHPFCEPFYITYDDSIRDITTTQIDLKIRDVKGIPNKDVNGNILAVDHRPIASEMSADIAYNLLNQGWYAIDAVSEINRLAYKSSVLSFYYTHTANPQGEFVAGFLEDNGGIGKFPSEAEIWWVYKAPQVPLIDSAGNPLYGTPKEAFSQLEFLPQQNRFGTGTAPKGHYILDAFNLDRSTASSDDVDPVNNAPYWQAAPISTVGLEVESSGYQRPSQTCFFAGRIFYAGVNSEGFNTKIYFSQVLDGSRNIEKCYQQEDPTSEQASDLLSTDGGIIEIPDVARIVKLFNMGNSLIVFSTNGIWSISGSQGIGFTATDYSIQKISNTEAISPASFVNVEGTPIWWNTDGIWTLQQAQQLALPNVTSLTINTIQTYFEDIPNASKFNVKGAYNPFTRIVQWLFRFSDEPVPDIENGETSIDAQEHYAYDSILNLDMNTGAFYPWSLPVTDYKIQGIITVKGTAIDYAQVGVTVDTVEVDANLVPVVVTEAVRTVLTSSTFKYITMNDSLNGLHNAEVVFSNMDDFVNYVDWHGTTEETAITSFFISGFKVRGEAIRKFQNNYIRIYNRGSTQFDLYGRWDFSSNANSGRWGQVQRVIMTDSNYTYGSKRLKIRGSGLSLNFKVTSVAGQPFKIIGWSNYETGNSAP